MKKTIGFNDKKNIWTSKYDYESSNYASIDKQFFSSRNRIEATDDIVAWEHHTNSSNNSFYGSVYPSVIAVSFNDNPSQNKLYKTFSVEGSENLTGSLHTFSTSETLQPNQPPRSITVGTLSNKGGILYGHMPRDTRIKANVNMKFLGQIHKDTEFLTIGGAFGDLYAFDGMYGAAPSVQGSTKLAFLFGNGNNPVIINPDGQILNLSTTVDYYTINSGINIPEASETAGGEESVLTKQGLVFKSTLPALNTLGAQVTANEGIVSVFAITDPEINGDFLRGQYAESVINLGSENFELYSLNVNYEPTDLDHSK